MKILLVVLALILVGCDLPPERTAHWNCEKGSDFYHKLNPGEDFKCPKGFYQHLMRKDTEFGLGTAPTDIVECECRAEWY